jgi:hypothetical protein
MNEVLNLLDAFSFIAIIIILSIVQVIRNSKNIFYILSGMALISFIVYIVAGSMILRNESQKKYYEITQNIEKIYVLDGKVIDINENLSNKFPWLFVRVNLERPSKEWEADAKELLIKNGWKPHPSDSNSLCKNGIKTTFETVPYQGKDYEIVTMLYDTVTKSKEECNYPHNEFLNWLR